MLGASTDNVYFHALPPLPSVFVLVNQGLAYLLYPLLGCSGVAEPGPTRAWARASLDQINYYS